ncbi:hypothetical protein [Solibacillus isronensis]|uniref:hypothetical protein n=1 Tax=Solibacillus isronensis TaxID=412383 RepID=UPI0009A75F8B|nr:hypothetical protein [Solibacillus isronensis]
MIQKLEPHKEHLTTVAHWNTYRKENPQYDLPSAHTLIRHFGTWQNVKSNMGLVTPVTYTDIRQYNETELLGILKPHSSYLAHTRSQWDAYIGESEEILPTSASLITYFGTWNRLKEQLGLSTAPDHRPPLYSKEDIISIVKKYMPISLSPRKWENFRKQQDFDLPSAQTINKYLSKDEKEQLKK